MSRDTEKIFALKAAIGVKFQATLNSKINQSNLDQSIARFWVGLSDVRCKAKTPPSHVKIAEGKFTVDLTSYGMSAPRVTIKQNIE